MIQPNRRQTDGERLAVAETRVSALEDAVERIEKTCAGILRNQWIQCGVIAFVMLLLKYPHLAALFVDTGSAMAAGVK